MNLMRHINKINKRDLTRFLPFMMGDDRVGWVEKSLAVELKRFEDVFYVEPERYVTLREHLNDFDSRTKAVAEVIEKLVEDGVLPRDTWTGPIEHIGMGLPRHEPYFVISLFYCRYFGARFFATLCNGISHDGRVWCARRSQSLTFFPGKMDAMAAGGKAYDITPRENLIKEGDEEASFSREIMMRARPTSFIRYCYEYDARRLFDEYLYVFDIDLQEGEIPQSRDQHEISSFDLLSFEEITQKLYDTDDFMININAVMIDLLIRRGKIPVSDPEYIDLCMGLRQRLVPPLRQ